MYNKFRLLVTTSMSVCVVAFYWSGDMTLDVDLEFLTFHFRSPAAVEGD